jgi:hypothetical protein
MHPVLARFQDREHVIPTVIQQRCFIGIADDKL